MPPKKKKSVKGGAGNIIDGVDTAKMTREQLEVFCHTIKEENELEREERNFFQMERDQIRTFWEITRNELEEARANLRNKDRQIEESTEKNEEELKFYKQKVKHVQFEQQNNLAKSKAELLVAQRLVQDAYSKKERQLLQDKRDLKALATETAFAHQEQTKESKLRHSEEESNTRVEFENKTKELETNYEKKYNELEIQLNTKHNMEMSEVEERKNLQIAELRRHHEKAFNDMKNYYNNITLNNLALINTLKDEMEELRRQNDRMNKQVADLTAQNKNLLVLLRRALDDVKEYERQMQNNKKDKMSLANTKVMLTQKTRELTNLRWSYDALDLRFEKLQRERDELHSSFFKAVLEVQQKSGVKNVLLQKRLQTVSQVAEHREVIIGELIASLQQPPARSNEKLEKILSKKNAVIDGLRYEVARVCKAHDGVLETVEEKLLQYGIPKQELGFKPLRFIPRGQGGLARGPAGLVAKNR